MRYAIVSDLHANLPSWRAVLRDIAVMEADRILCLGDVVGYGPQPAELVESVYADVWRVALGNHDAALCGRMDTSAFREEARSILEWTRGRLSASALKMMSAWPLQLAGRTFRCAHGAFDAPAQFPYVEDAAGAARSWAAAPETILFVGHTHRPALYVIGASGTPHEVAPQDFAIEGGKRYLVNVGSVGCPRDGDTRASYVMYDEGAGTIVFRRVPFDLDACRSAIAAAGISEVGFQFLRADPLLGRRSLREIVSFRPPASPDGYARGAVEIEDVEQLRGRVKAWRRAAVGMAAALAAALAVGGALAWRHATRTRVLEAVGAPDISALSGRPEANLLPLPSRTRPPFEGWTVRYGNRFAQSVTAIEESTEPAFVLRSAAPAAPIELESAPIAVAPGQRIALEAVFVKAAGFDGVVALGAALTRIAPGGASETLESFVMKEPTLRRRDGWAARETVEIPAGGRILRVRIVGRFRGEAAVRSISAARRGS